MIKKQVCKCVITEEESQGETEEERMLLNLLKKDLKKWFKKLKEFINVNW